MVEVTVIAEGRQNADRGIDHAFNAMAEIDNLMSSYKSGSDVSRVGRGAGEVPVKVDPLTMEVVKRGIYYGDISGGAFDITAGKIKKLYAFQKGGEIPDPSLLKREVELIEYKNITIRQPDSVYLPVKGMSIDLGGIAKGFAIDKAIEALRGLGIRDGMVNAGGDMRVIGTKNGKFWKVGVLGPRKEGLFGILTIRDISVATSGDYMQFFEKNGRRYTHIINPASGKSPSGLRSVTVIAPKSVDSDALSTTVFVMGHETGLRLIERTNKAEAMTVDQKGKVRMSSVLI